MGAGLDNVMGEQPGVLTTNLRRVLEHMSIAIVSESRSPSGIEGGCSMTGRRLGIIGGGQLAKMTAAAAYQLGCHVAVLERHAARVATALTTHALVGDWNTPEDLLRLGELSDVVTLENEFVEARALAALEAAGHPVFPSARTIGLVQDKLIQKETLRAEGLAVPAFRAVHGPADVQDAAREVGYPLLLKARRNGYDGKGNYTVRGEQDIATAWRALGGDMGCPLFVEAFCPFVRELAVIIARGRQGEMAVYPLVETVQKNHICHLVRAPAEVSEDVMEAAIASARKAVASVGGVGCFGVEMFLTKDQQVWVNELAPRVHNSGHYTMEACVCSQFENHVRAVMGWPLGCTALKAPAAVMVNLLGAGAGPGLPAGFERALSVPGAHIHIYGKARSSAGRKMGHITVLSDSVPAAEQAALRSASELCFGKVAR